MFGDLPRRFFLTSGFGDASTPLNAFDAALLRAGVGDTNLIKLSSILPPAATEIPTYKFPRGSMVPLAYAELTASQSGATIAAAVAVGIPEDPNEAGLIMECSHVGDAQTCEEAAREMVREGMEIIRGRGIREIKSISVSHAVERVGAVFAAVVLCP
jgi:arginine decarboxylase